MPADPISRKTLTVYYIDGPALRALRESLGHGMREWARELGISHAYLGQLETASEPTAISGNLAARLIPFIHEESADNGDEHEDG